MDLNNINENCSINMYDTPVDNLNLYDTPVDNLNYAKLNDDMDDSQILNNNVTYAKLQKNINNDTNNNENSSINIYETPVNNFNYTKINNVDNIPILNNNINNSVTYAKLQKNINNNIDKNDTYTYKLINKQAIESTLNLNNKPNNDYNSLLTPTLKKQVIYEQIRPVIMNEIHDKINGRKLWNKVSDNLIIISKIMTIIASIFAFAGSKFTEIWWLSFLSGILGISSLSMIQFGLFAHNKYKNYTNDLNLLLEIIHLEKIKIPTDQQNINTSNNI
jgi:hypothetical protein